MQAVSRVTFNVGDRVKAIVKGKIVEAVVSKIMPTNMVQISWPSSFGSKWRVVEAPERLIKIV